MIKKKIITVESGVIMRVAVRLEKSLEDPLVVAADLLSNALGQLHTIESLEGVGDGLETSTIVGNEDLNERKIVGAGTLASLVDTLGKVLVEGSDTGDQGVTEVATCLRLDGVFHALLVPVAVVAVDEGDLLEGVAGKKGHVGTLVGTKAALTSLVEGLSSGSSASRINNAWRGTRSVEEGAKGVLVVAGGLRLDDRLERLAELALEGGSDGGKLIGELGHDIDENTVVGASALHGLVEELSEHLVTGHHELGDDAAVVAAGLGVEVVDNVLAEGALVLGGEHLTLHVVAVGEDVDKDGIVGANTTHGIIQTTGICCWIIHC